jgi:hypothetical protein
MIGSIDGRQLDVYSLTFQIPKLHHICNKLFELESYEFIQLLVYYLFVSDSLGYINHTQFNTPP